MASLRDIRTRIASIKNTQQITKAMKMVAAAKMKKAQDAILAARPYAQKMHLVLSSLAARTETEAHPLLRVREPYRVGLLVLTSDRGLCGGFNSTLSRRALAFIGEQDRQQNQVTNYLIGKKGRNFFKSRQIDMFKVYTELSGQINYSRVSEIVQDLVEPFEQEELDVIYMVYNEFKSAISQKVVVEQLLPVKPLEMTEQMNAVEYIYEPSEQEVLAELLPQYAETQVYRALLESEASEQGARMTAMDAATNNARDLINQLTLTMNKARQAQITKEISEIVGGAEAL
ncbi:MAG: ATP synthase F1 subunit gamma [bacterium]|nr:ATP synthase F1 subunit gamma [bacterium]